MDIAPTPSTRAASAVQLKMYLDSLRRDVEGQQMLISSDCDRAACSKELDAVIDEMQLAFKGLTASLLRERNALNRIASLPGDIVKEILIYEDLPGILRASFVCHAWRTVAVNQPSLWKSVNMESRNYSERLLKMQLERSGVVPLDLHFNLMDSRIQCVNRLVPDEIHGLIARSQSITNIVASTLPQELIPLPSLESLYLVLNEDQSEIRLGPHPKLRHLSISCRGHPISNPASGFSRLLHTLHLHGGIASAKDTLLFIMQLPKLRELSLEGFLDHSSPIPIPEHILTTAHLPKLQLIRLLGLSFPFLTQFLVPQLIQSQTNLYIDPFPPNHRSSSFDMLRYDLSSSIWIDFAKHSIIYHHDTAVTHIILENDPDRQLIFSLPRCFEAESVLSLSWINGDPLDVKQLTPFRSLVQLSFVFSPSFVGSKMAQLESVICGDLIYTCPNLSYIGMVLRKAVATSITYVDNAEHVIMEFLDGWLEFHGEIFSEVQIQDEIKPTRWEEYIPILQGLAETFEVGRVSAPLQAPAFPACRQFKPKPSRSGEEVFRGFAQLTTL